MIVLSIWEFGNIDDKGTDTSLTSQIITRKVVFMSNVLPAK